MTAPLNGSESPVAVKPLVSRLNDALALQRDCTVCDGDGIKPSGRECGGCDGTGKVLVHRGPIRDLFQDALLALASPVAGREEVDHLELALCRAYERGAHWSMENAGDLEYLPKAARDHADKAIASTPILTADKAEIAELRLSEREQGGKAQREIARAESAERDKAALMEALTPSGETKAAYLGEFNFEIDELDEYGETVARIVTVPWDAVKEIMAAIRARAILAEQKERE